MKHPIENLTGAIVARCTKARHEVELIIVPETVSGGIKISARCACCFSSGFIGKSDVLILVEDRQPIRYDQFVLTIE